MPEIKDRKEVKQEHADGGGHGCMTIIVIVMLLVGMLFAAIPLFVQYYTRRGMDPTALARLEDFKTRPVAIPPSWRTAKPFSPAFRQKLEDWNSAWRTSKSSVLELSGKALIDRLAEGEELSSDEWTSIAAVLSAGGPLMDAATTATMDPEFDLDVLSSFNQLGNTDSGGYLMITSTMRVFVCSSQLSAKEGRFRDAVNAALMPLQMSRRSEASSVIAHLMAVSLEAVTAKNIAQISRACSDVALIAEMLAEMNRLDRAVNMNIMDQYLILDYVAVLRSAMREGYPVEFYNDRPAAFYFDQSMKVQGELPKWMLERMPDGDPRKPGLAQAVERSSGNPYSPKSLSQKVVVSLVFMGGKDLFYKFAMPYHNIEAGVREKAAQATYDLTRLALAQRIMELSGRDPHTTHSAFIPEFLPEEPEDPFAVPRAGLNYDTASRQFYSVGPDKRDDGCKHQYNPTSGTLSSGDIFLFDDNTSATPSSVAFPVVGI